LVYGQTASFLLHLLMPLLVMMLTLCHLLSAPAASQHEARGMKHAVLHKLNSIPGGMLAFEV